MHCTTERFSIGQLWIEKNKIDVDPPYQRETGVWSKEKQQLFVDSLINSFDVPKIYFHDLRSNRKPISFAVIDGKQRLSSIWGFVENHFPLGEGFEFRGDEEFPPTAGQYFHELSDRWQEIIKSKLLDIVLVQYADSDDIEDLFSRLNNGEPLTAAEKRNALGGEMCELIRRIVKHDFFAKKVAFSNKRMAHYEVAAKFIRIEFVEAAGGGRFCDLKKKHLDDLVKDNKRLTVARIEKLYRNVDERLNVMMRVFEDGDPNLSKQSYPQIYYIFIKYVMDHYAHRALYTKLKEFFPAFASERRENNEREPEEERDWHLTEYGRLAMQGTNDMTSMELRNEILMRFFLTYNEDVEVRDKRRRFNDEERYVVWHRAGRKCEECGKDLLFSEFDADHVKKWAEGGKTTLRNARALCRGCNRGDNLGVT